MFLTSCRRRYCFPSAYRLLFGFIVFATITRAAASDIVWEVDNRFPLFEKPDNFRAVLDVWKVNETASEFLSRQTAESLRKLLKIHETQWDKQTGTYRPEWLRIRRHSLLVTVTETAPEARCEWFINDEAKGIAPCSKQYLLENAVDEKVLFSLKVVIDGQETMLPDQQKVESELILGFGDSFSSGEGNPDHAAILGKKSLLHGLDWFIRDPSQVVKADAQWWDNACHRSFLSWQALFALRRAVSDPHKVVRFVSFACSGAEIYDGFFRAQLDPPGPAQVRRGKGRGWRDGGAGYYATKDSDPLKPIQEDRLLKLSGVRNPRLPYSQLNAAIRTLCKEKTTKTAPFTSRKPQSSYNKIHFGEVDVATCPELIEQPSMTLISLGGNDVGFSGVVKFALFPRDVRNDLFREFRKAGLSTVKEIGGIIDPTIAGKATTVLPSLFDDVFKALTEHLSVGQGSVHALVYPDPLPQKINNKCEQRISTGFESMGQILKNESRFAAGWTFTVDTKKLNDVRSEFIEKVRAVQFEKFKSYAKPVDANVGFGKKGEHSICAVSPECDAQEDQCGVSDAFGWKEKEKYPLRVLKASEWEPYSAHLARRLRTANDVILTQFMKSDPSRAPKREYIYGTAHPTAAAHAAIADSLYDDVAQDAKVKRASK